MKLLPVSILAVALGMSLMASGRPLGSRRYLASDDVYLNALESYYRSHNTDFRRQSIGPCVASAEYYAAKLSLSSHIKDILTIPHVESTWGFDKGHYRHDIKSDGWGDDGKSFGKWQVQLGLHEADGRAFWRRHGETLGANSDCDTQAALAVYVYYKVLQSAHGNTFDALRRYNGRGAPAIFYAKQVKKYSREIFGKGSQSTGPSLWGRVKAWLKKIGGIRISITVAGGS